MAIPHSTPSPPSGPARPGCRRSPRRRPPSGRAPGRSSPRPRPAPPPARAWPGRRCRAGCAGPPALPVLPGEPGGGQVEPPVQQGIAPAAGVAEVDPRLAVVLLAGVPAPLPGDPHRVGALLGRLVAVDD